MHPNLTYIMPLFQTVEGRISHFAVLSNIQTKHLVLSVYAYLAGQRAGDAVAEQRADYCNYYRYADTCCLCAKLRPVAIDSAVISADRSLSEYARQQTAPYSARTVAAESVERVIEAELLLAEGDHHEANGAGG